MTTHADKSGISRVISDGSTGTANADTAEERAVAKLADEFADAMQGLEARAIELAD